MSDAREILVEIANTDLAKYRGGTRHTDVPRLVAALTAVLNEHTPIIVSNEQTADFCRVDDELLPCRTVRLLTKALAGDPQ